MDDAGDTEKRREERVRDEGQPDESPGPEGCLRSAPMPQRCGIISEGQRFAADITLNCRYPWRRLLLFFAMLTKKASEKCKRRIGYLPAV